MCVLTNERHKTYRNALVMPKGWGMEKQGVPRWSQLVMWQQIDRGDVLNRMQVKFSPSGQPGDLWVRSKGQILKFQLQNQFQRFLYQTLCVFSQIRYKKLSNGIFIL